MIFNNLNVFDNFLNFDWFSSFHVVHDGFGIWTIGVENITRGIQHDDMGV
jgi:hypothetical protein